MKSMIALSALLLAASVVSAEAKLGTYEIDRSHTNVVFMINHLGFSNYIGKFGDIDGSFTFDEAKPETSQVKVTIRPASVNSASATLDEDLKGPDYFDTAKFPDATFVSDKIEVTGKDTGKIHGTFTLRGVSKPLVLEARLNKCGYHIKTNVHVCGFSAKGLFKRSDYGMTSLTPYVGDDVSLTIELEGMDKNNVQTVTPSKKQ